MNNKEIARSFDLLAKIMEFKGENPYKIRSYQRISGTLKKVSTPLSDMSEDEINAMEGVGKAISGKIQELLDSGSMQTLERYKSEVPVGIVELLQVKGIGPKKIQIAWKALGVESATELLYACNENRLVELKGFGAKTQEEMRRQLEFFLRNRSNFLHVNAEGVAVQLMSLLQEYLPDVRKAWTGAYRRCDPVLDKLELILCCDPSIANRLRQLEGIQSISQDGDVLSVVYLDVPVAILCTSEKDFEKTLFYSTGPEDLVRQLENTSCHTEEAYFEALDMPYLAPEARALACSGKKPPERLIEKGDIRGVVHAHSLYSDGINSLEEMASHCQQEGYAYFVVTDHSQIAVYANGVKPEDVVRQWNEIDALNAHAQGGFRVVKGIECDILTDGSLDYDDEILSGFEVVIASVHTNIKMDKEKATTRIVKAIESPHTNILGHPTGRLLLGREGYPLNMKKVIDACAANQVAIELNASPYRLDLDWIWISYARERDVLISINPDAHAKEAIEYIDFGVKIARKGWLDKEGCLNARAVEPFLAFCNK